jgi:hypothetical protein
VIWALWSSRVDPYSEPELIQLFRYRYDADLVKSGLIGKPRKRDHLFGVWQDDEDFPDLYVRPVELH